MPRISYCPRCATELVLRHDGGRERQACPDGDCGFVFFGDFSIGCAGVVLREDGGVTRALLIQRGQPPYAGTWQLPGGYAEHDELLTTAVEREVREEAAVEARFRDVVGFRHMIVGPSTNIYVVCRLDYVGGEPASDGDETAAAGFYSFDEMESMQGVQGISRWGIRHALESQPGSGLSVDDNGSDNRWQMFGLTDVDPRHWRG